MLTHENVVTNSSAFLKCIQVSGQLKKGYLLKCKPVLILVLMLEEAETKTQQDKTKPKAMLKA